MMDNSYFDWRKGVLISCDQMYRTVTTARNGGAGGSCGAGRCTSGIGIGRGCTGSGLTGATNLRRRQKATRSQQQQQTSAPTTASGTHHTL
jgi:membrane protease subunit (stomatin/prohibitin family)